jgi:phosphate transport system substrate-binding protein
VLTAVIPMGALPASAGATTLFGSGSSAEQPIMNVLFRSYNRLHHNIRFNYLPDGGNAGVQDVQAGRRLFAVNTRPPLPSDSGTIYFKLFLDGLCVAVNQSNSLKNLSIAQARNIFLAHVTSWSNVTGSNLLTTIDPLGRDSTAGSYTFFQQAVLNGATQASSVQQLASDGLVQTGIQGDRNAIGYVGLAHAGKGSHIKALKLNNVPCNAAHIKSQKYPLTRFIWGALALKHPNKNAAKFFDWVRTSKAAGKIISTSGAVPAFNK